MKNQKKAVPGALTEKLPSGFTFEMAYVEGGLFHMGSTGKEAYYDEHPIHEVKLDSFYIGKFPVVESLWEAVMNEDKAAGKQGLPMEMVSWKDVREFLQKLNQLTGKNYRLPTEAEWEYAARGGQKSNGYDYPGGNDIEEVGWYIRNSDGSKKAVGQKRPNELGLYDLCGNVLEWCWDKYSGAYYEDCRKRGVVENPEGPKEGVYRVLRGGSWYLDERSCRCTYRHYEPLGGRFTDIGFRLALSLEQ